MALTISIEGGDGAGKSSVIAELAKYFEEKLLRVATSREPGGVRISEKIREILLDREYVELHPRTEALLFASARAQHYFEKIVPMQEQYDLVIIDRFLDSSASYQGYARGLGIDAVLGINDFALGGYRPDLTILLDIDPEIGLQRIAKDGAREVNKLDLEALEFHRAVREGFLEIARREPERFVVIDASQDLPNVVAQAVKAVEAYL